MYVYENVPGNISYLPFRTTSSVVEICLKAVCNVKGDQSKGVKSL